MNRDSEPRRLKILLYRLSEWVEPHIMERGRDYYEFDHVERMEIERNVIYAIVRGSNGYYNTTVNLADFGKSECDCPYEDYCKHMVAVVYAAAEQDKDASIDKPVPTVDSAMTLLSRLSHEDLLEVIGLALQDKPKLVEHMSLWFDRFQTRQDMKRVLVRMDTLEAIRYFEERVRLVVMQAEQMFESDLWDGEEEGYNSWGDPVYSSYSWHCKKGISHVRNWCDTLLEALTDETAVVVVVGLALTVSRVASWPRVYPKEAERELSDALHECGKALEAAVVGLQSAMVRNPELRKAYMIFTDWVADGCKNMGYLVDWTEVLSTCILDGPHLMQVYEKVLAKNPEFLLSEELLDNGGGLDDASSGSKKYNGYGRYLVDWWCRLCLLYGKTEEAEKALLPSGTEAGPVAGTATIRMLANYFVGNGDRRKAAHYTSLAVRLNPQATAQDYEWVSEMYKSIQMMPESVLARQQAFLSWPTFERFDRWARNVQSVEERQSKTEEWAASFANKGQIGLACRMLWTVGLVEEAWRALSCQRIAVYMIDDNLVEFLKRFETYDVERAVKVYQEIAMSFIRDKHRSSYRQATIWLQAMRDAWISTSQEDTWRHFIDAFQNEHQRLSALRDEVRKAGLV